MWRDEETPVIGFEKFPIKIKEKVKVQQAAARGRSLLCVQGVSMIGTPLTLTLHV